MIKELGCIAWFIFIRVNYKYILIVSSSYKFNFVFLEITLQLLRFNIRFQFYFRKKKLIDENTFVLYCLETKIISKIPSKLTKKIIMYYEF